MLYPMIDPSFSNYGRIEDLQVSASENVSHIVIEQQDHQILYCFDYDTFWDYEEGMTVLLIQDTGEQKLYYMDRAVTIFAGIHFGFYPLSSQSRILTNTELTKALSNTVFSVPNRSAEVHQLSVFTLFHQHGSGGLYFRGEQHLPLELVYVEKGLLHNYCSGQDLPLRPKELLLFGPNQWHMQYSDNDIQFLTVSFLWPAHDFSSLTNQVISASAEVQKTVQALLMEHGQTLNGRDEVLHTLFQLLLLQLLRQPRDTGRMSRPSPVTEKDRRDTLDQALQVVSRQKGTRLTVPQLAAAVNVSTSQLTVLFQRYLGIPPAKYITRVRLEESKILLSRRQMSVAEVAEQLGYTSIQHFSKQFRQWNGCSPTAYLHCCKGDADI
jgi:AraC-like DNA-binding protein